MWNGVKCDTITKCFKKCVFVDVTAKNLAEELLSGTVDWLREIDVNNKGGADGDDDDVIVSDVVAKSL